MIEETEKRLKERDCKNCDIGAMKKAINSLCISESDFEDWVEIIYQRYYFNFLWYIISTRSHDHSI